MPLRTRDQPYLERFLCVIPALKVLVVVVLVSCIKSHEDFRTCLDHTVSRPLPSFCLPTRRSSCRPLQLYLHWRWWLWSSLYRPSKVKVCSSIHWPLTNDTNMFPSEFSIFGKLEVQGGTFFKMDKLISFDPIKISQINFNFNWHCFMITGEAKPRVPASRTLLAAVAVGHLESAKTATRR